MKKRIIPFFVVIMLFVSTVNTWASEDIIFQEEVSESIVGFYENDTDVMENTTTEDTDIVEVDELDLSEDTVIENNLEEDSDSPDKWGNYHYNGFEYRLIEENAWIIAYHNPELTYKDEIEELVIPSEINGHKVTVVSFSDWDVTGKLKSIVLPDYMEIVDMHNFDDCFYLESITLGKYTKKFYQVGWRDHHDPLILKAINVPADNPYLKNVSGAVYSKDGKVFWAFPAGKEQTSLAISSNTTTIARGAFFESKLKRIKFRKNLAKINKNAFYCCFHNKAKSSDPSNPNYVKKILVPKGPKNKYKDMLSVSGVNVKRADIKYSEY